ncbi:hypothetical protein SpCBS45565_g07217 [Spizellomyces sp. 'palustris']|nr:hypothetical protein SpCBS45565_g07217 [Spizellomyces sp. 'palustris']
MLPLKTFENIRIYEDERDRLLQKLSNALGAPFTFPEPEFAKIWEKVQNDGDRGDRLGEIIYGSYLKALVDNIASKDDQTRKAILEKTPNKIVVWKFGAVE